MAGAIGAAGLAAAALIGCAVGVRRNLNQVPPKQVIFDDQCHLQQHFDDLASGFDKPPAVIQAGEIQAVDTEKTLGGKSTFRFEEDASLRALRSILVENWKPLPAEVMRASEVDLEVRWREKVGTRWVVSDAYVELRAAGKVLSLAPHPCLTSLLFGQPLYNLRRELLNPPPVAPPAEAPYDASIPDLRPAD